jgi:phage FluMu gp28-like protein
MSDTATGKVFLPYQQRLLASVSRHAVTVVEKSRRTGYSWAAAAVAALWAASSKAAGGQDVYYMGYNLEMAREFIDYVADWAKKMDRAVSGVAETVFKDPDNPDKDVKAFRITFDSGFEVVALPAKARALRGMQGLVLLDEAAFMDDLDEVLKAAFALLIWGGKVVVISTHNGEDNPFNQLIQEIRAGKKPYHLERCTFDDALADGLYRRISRMRGEAWTAETEAAWRDDIIAFYGDAADEELHCIPSKGAGAWLSLSTLEAAAEAGADIPVLKWSLNDSFAQLSERLRNAEARDWCADKLDPLLADLPEVPSYVGVDFARSADLTVIWPVLVNDRLVRRPPFVVELRNVPFEQQRHVLFHLLDRLPRFSGAALDAGGNGAYLAEVAWQRYGAGRVAQVKFTEDWYRENMPPYKAALQDGEFVLPKDRDVVNDHRAIKLERGVAKVPARRGSGADGSQRHGDAAIAAALAHYASRMQAVAYGYHAAPTARPLDEGRGGSGRLTNRPDHSDDLIGVSHRGAW